MREVSLIVDTIQTQIRGIYPYEELDARLSYCLPGAWFNPAVQSHGWDGKAHLLEGNRFPSGLLPVVTELFEEHGTRYRVIDRRVPVKKNFSDINLEGKELYPYQRLAVAQMLRTLQGVVKIPTAGGKTLIAAAVIQALNLPAIYIVHTSKLLSQTYEVFSEHLPEVGMVGGGKRQWKKVTVAMVQTLMTLIKQGKTDIFDQYQVMFVDEAHHLGSPTKAQWYVASTYFQKAFVRFGMTATPIFKKSGMLMQGATGPLIVDVPVQKLQEEGYVSGSRSRFITIETPQLDGLLTFTEAYQFGIVDNDIRNKIAVSEAVKAAKQNKLVMLFVERREHGKILEKIISSQLKKIKTIEYAFLSGWNPQMEIEEVTKAAKTKNIKILIVTRKLFGEGVDIPAVDVLINVAGWKAAVAFTQMFGRGLRTSEGKTHLEYIDFYDKTHRYLRDHSEVRIRHCKSMKQSVHIENPSIHLEVSPNVNGNKKSNGHVARGSDEAQRQLPFDAAEDRNIEKRVRQLTRKLQRLNTHSGGRTSNTRQFQATGRKTRY